MVKLFFSLMVFFVFGEVKADYEFLLKQRGYWKSDIPYGPLINKESLTEDMTLDEYNVDLDDLFGDLDLWEAYKYEKNCLAHLIGVEGINRFKALFLIADMHVKGTGGMFIDYLGAAKYYADAFRECSIHVSEHIGALEDRLSSCFICRQQRAYLTNNSLRKDSFGEITGFNPCSLCVTVGDQIRDLVDNKEKYKAQQELIAKWSLESYRYCQKKVSEAKEPADTSFYGYVKSFF